MCSVPASQPAAPFAAMALWKQSHRASRFARRYTKPEEWPSSLFPLSFQSETGRPRFWPLASEGRTRAGL
jgi:hypothetical protein